MIGLAINRFAQAIPTFIVVSILMFLLLFVGPNPLEQLKQNPNITPKDVKRLTHQYGWDRPLPVQYLSWAGNFVRGDLGESVTTRRPARQLIFERLPLTLFLTGLSMIFSLMIAVPVGAYTALKRGTTGDNVVTVTTFAMMAAPSFFIGLLFQLMALKLLDATGHHIFFTAGPPGNPQSLTYWITHPVDVFQHMALPVITLSIIQVAGWSRYLRSELITVLGAEYIRSANAKGIAASRVFWLHAMRNTLLPLVTIVALDVALLFGGATITESVFGLPGMGRLLLESVMGRDVVVVLDIVMIGTVLVLLFSAIADVLYGVLDPRVRAS